MNGLFAPHATAGPVADELESIQTEFEMVVYDPEYPDWYIVD